MRFELAIFVLDYVVESMWLVVMMSVGLTVGARRRRLIARLSVGGAPISWPAQPFASSRVLPSPRIQHFIPFIAETMERDADPATHFFPDGNVDLYGALGVEKEAGADEIKKAYRK